MEVIKRDGTKESYNSSKIEKAVEKAMFATYKFMEPVMLSEPFTVSLYVWDVIKDVKEPVSIKQLENIIFRKLTDDGYSDAAVNYIEYKTKRDIERSKHKLTQDFLDKYPDYPDCMDELAKFVYIRTYSRWLPDKNRRETWKETCARAINGNCSYLPTEDGEPEKLFDNMFNLRQRISGRMLWMGGTEALDKTPLAAYNCSGIVMDNINAFHELFYLLMVGTGVGCRVLKEDIAKLPKFDTAKKLYHVKTPVPQGTTLERTKVSNYGNSIIITVGDSKEGWCEALTAYLNTMTDNTTKSISIDYSYIRPQGAPLKTFGGYASGYVSLKEMFEKLNKIITEESTNGKLRPLNVADMCNIVGQNVVAGGTRRTAELILFSPDDEEMLHAKENLDPEHYFRYMSNNSMYLEEKPSHEELTKIMKSIKETGEPAFISVEGAKKRRPDFEICNPCQCGDSLLLTVDGYKTFAELNNTEPYIVNAKCNITQSKVWYNGVKPCVKMVFRGGHVINCTADHVYQDEFGNEVEAKDMIGKKPNIMLQPHVIPEDTQFVKLGFIQGDGILSSIKQGRALSILLGSKDDDVVEYFGLSRDDFSRNGTQYQTREFNTILTDLGFSLNVLPERVLPSSYDTWTPQQKLSFLRGLYSANGSVISNGRIAFKTTCAELAEQLVVALKEFNINTYITTNKSHEVQFSNGLYKCKESYDVNIQRYFDRVVFYQLVGFIQKYKMDRLHRLLAEQTPKVSNIIDIGLQKVYDFTEPECHFGNVNAVVTSNCAEILLPSRAVCNLTNINVSKFVDERGNVMLSQLKEACKLSARACYRLTEPELELEWWSEIHHRDRLIGCSITGWQDAVSDNMTKFEQEELLTLMKTWIKDAANEYADENNRPHPVLYTTVQPDGTGGLISGCSAGVHYNHSPYYFRRVRISTNSPLYQAIKYLDGWQIDNEVGQDDNGNTKVITFPCKSNSRITKYNVSAIEQLEQYKMMQTHYVDHNTSITVTVKDDEWDAVTDWLDKNWDCVVGISFLSLNQDYYPLMPYEECTEKQYLELKSKMAPFDQELVNKYEFELQTVGKDFEIDESGECEDGHCPVR
jgi:ribonucleotide reductase alpha subunit